jgi:ribonucleoside-diphosphate reductase alpha chain
MKIERHFTDSSFGLESLKWKQVDVLLKDEETGKVIYDIKGSWVPEGYSAIASNIMVGKYFRLVGVPSETEFVDEKNVKGVPFPAWLRRRTPKKGCTTGPESHAFQVFSRLAGFWAYWGWMYGYFDEERDAKAFYDESIYMMANQMAAPNSPQMFNSGIFWAYGITREPKGYWRVDPVSGVASQTKDFYEYPGLHACYILHQSDHLFNDDCDGIYDNIAIETRAFAQGGGAGANFSNIRSRYEKLSTGGRPTGLISFLKVFDRSASVIKSGSGQRRSSKMVILNMDHPEIEDFINWKVVEEKKADALIKCGYEAAYEGEAYSTVSGQNSNNSVRVTDAFMNAVKEDKDWNLTARTTGEVIKKVKARQLWDMIIKAAWRTGDPGIQFDDHHNKWNTCAIDGRINATNPCAELSFLDNTACNLASLNMQKFFERELVDAGPPRSGFSINDFEYACQHWAMVLDISNSAAQFPSKAIAMGTHNYRLIGLGHTGMGAVLMRLGIPYDSPEACLFMSVVTSIMTANVYVRSAELAGLGAFPRFTKNRDSMLNVIHKHCACDSKLEDAITNSKLPDVSRQVLMAFKTHSEVRWRAAFSLGKVQGYRNAFVTLIAPTGTIGLLLGCDTLSIEPDFSLVKFKKLSGGGTMKIVNESVSEALHGLGYSDNQTIDIMTYVLGHNSFDGAPHINRQTLESAGISKGDLSRIEEALCGVTELRYALSLLALSDESKHAMNLESSDKNIFKKLGVSKEEYVEANLWICGRGTLEGAPHVKQEHLAVFDCANRNGSGSRFIRPEAHVNVMAAVTPFISGAISKTVNLPSNATEADIDKVYKTSWEMGVKNITIYRDGCKRSQPLMSSSDLSWWDEIVTMSFPRGKRKRPPKKRIGVTQEFTIHTDHGDVKVWATTGEDENGLPCEVWVDVSGKQNPEFRLALKWWARAVSNALQYGQPLDEIADSFILEEGGPSGKTDNRYLTFCKSIPDLVMKWIKMEYLANFDWCKRRPPISELRVSELPELAKVVGLKKSHVRVVHAQADAPVLMVSVQNIQKCPFCGSTSIIRWPCPLCASCGAQLGGCSA